MPTLRTELLEAVEWDRLFGSAFKVFQVCADHNIDLLLHIHGAETFVVIQTDDSKIAAMKAAETPMIAIEAVVRDFVERLDEAEAGV